MCLLITKCRFEITKKVVGQQEVKSVGWLHCQNTGCQRCGQQLNLGKNRQSQFGEIVKFVSVDKQTFSETSSYKHRDQIWQNLANLAKL